jgi:hypothetical protein
MTLACLIYVNQTKSNGHLLITQDDEKSFSSPISLLLFTTLLMLVGESMVIFKKHVKALSGKGRFISLGVSAVLGIATLSTTLSTEGREIIWFSWLITSLCILLAQIVYIGVCIVANQIRYMRMVKNRENLQGDEL